MNFSSNLKELRDTQHITQEQLAELLQVSRPTIARYEAQRRQPDFEKLEKLSDFFDVSIDYLLTGSEFEPINMTPPKTLPEKKLNHQVSDAYKKLSFESKQDVLKYIELLQLRDEKMKK